MKLNRNVVAEGYDFEESFYGKVALVLGSGATGMSVIRWLSDTDVAIRLVENDSNSSNLKKVKKLFPNVDIFCGPMDLKFFDGVDMVISSPGVPLSSFPYDELIQKGVPVIGDIELFARDNEVHQNVKTVAITGTNGKSTVTRMVEHVLKNMGLDALAVGNVGLPVLDVLCDIRDKKRPRPDVFVLELSSFQLDLTRFFDFDAVTVLNVSDDHLDRYVNFDDYAASKQRLFSGNSIKVVNVDDTLVSNMASGTDKAIGYGLSAPTDSQLWGVKKIDGEMFLMRGDEAVCSWSECQVSGSHNLSNVLAALALSDSVTPSDRRGLASIVSFRGLRHRMEKIREIDGVSFYNDSKATNVGAATAAIQSLSEKCVVILGGDSKKQDFSSMANILNNKARAVILIGKDSTRIKNMLEDISVPILFASDLSDAVMVSRGTSQRGDSILLSPACASFDMFDDYAHRGDSFADLVRNLN